MSNNKRFYWLKLMKDFFQQAKIKKLRKIAGGDTYVLIYLKMMMLSINSNGIIIFESIEPTLEEELALVLDEDLENIKVLVAYLIATKLIEQKSNTEFFMVEVPNLVGSETASTQRSRKSREKQKALQCNTNATTQQQIATNSNTEKEIEKEIEIYIDDDEVTEILQWLNTLSIHGIQELVTDYINYAYQNSQIRNPNALEFDIKSKITNQDKKTLMGIDKFTKDNVSKFLSYEKKEV